MTLELALSLALFALVSSVTPGPNNMMLMASGVNFGFQRTIPHMLGIEVGFGLLLLAVGAGLGALIHAVPGLSLAMKVASVLYLLWLAWKIASAEPTGDAAAANPKPLTIAQAAAFQLVNPKAWAMAIFAMGLYVDDAAPVLTVAIVTSAFLVVGVPSATIWIGFGVSLRRLLADPKRLRAFNIVMGLALVASIWPLLR